MASSSSWTATNMQDRPTIRKINDAVYELYKPAQGFVDIEIIFFHGLQAQNNAESYLKTWMLPDDTECWLNILLAEEFPQARIMSVSYDSTTQVSASAGRMDMYTVGENLAQSIIRLGRIGQTCPVVLVGHCIGGLVLKQVCLQADQMAAWEMDPGINPYKTFLGNMKGAFLFSTPNSGSRLGLTSEQSGPLLQYLNLLSKDSARLNDSFRKLRHQQGWKISGVSEASETKHCNTIRMLHASSSLCGRKPDYSLVVEEGSARYDMDDFCILPGEDNFTICKPRHRTSSSFLHFVSFVQEILLLERMVQQHWRSTLRLPRIFVDMPKRVERVIEMLQLGAEQPSRLALVGMGGKGKTTLAKAVFIEIQPDFDFVCFVEDVKGRLKVKRQRIENLVVDNLYAARGRKVRLLDGDAQSLWLHLLGKRVLIVLDDVDSEEQISSLLLPNWLGAGSRLIVTSRTRSSAVMHAFQICEVPFLSFQESYDLFLAHLDDDISRELPQNLIWEVLEKCGGLPLALEVIGSYLCSERSVDVWISALKKLTKAESLDGSVEDRLWAKLKVSFDDLAPLERKMFLDLALFDDWKYDVEIWKAVWESGFDGSSVCSGLRNLVDRAFIELKTSDEFSDVTQLCKVEKFWIHKQLRDLGKRISRPNEEKIELCRGVWEVGDIMHLFSKHKGVERHTEVVSAKLYPPTTTSTYLRKHLWSSIAQLQELRLLRLSNVCMTGNENLRFPSKLALLHLSCCFEDPTRSFNFLRRHPWPIREEDVEGLHQLTVLWLDNCTSVRIPHNFHRLRSLKILIIRGEHLESLPEKFGCLPSLKVLILEGIRFSQLPDSFLHLSSLQTLALKGCSASKCKAGVIPQPARWRETIPLPLGRLRSLKLEDLQDLTHLPKEFVLLESLESLVIIRCSFLEVLPEGFEKLVKLQCLKIKQCRRLESLPEPLGELASLVTLKISRCPRLRSLPDSVGHIQSLASLKLDCLKLPTVPEWVGEMKNLKTLSLLGLDCIQQLPGLVGQLQSLRSLRILEYEDTESTDQHLYAISCARIFAKTPEYYDRLFKRDRFLKENPLSLRDRQRILSVEPDLFHLVVTFFEMNWTCTKRIDWARSCFI